MEKLDFQEEEKEEEKFAGISLKLFIKEYDLADKLGEGINSDVIKIKKKVGFCFLICRKIYARSDFEELTLINNMMHEIGILDRLDHDGIPKVLVCCIFCLFLEISNSCWSYSTEVLPGHGLHCWTNIR